jgi:hypothetical protein
MQFSGLLRPDVVDPARRVAALMLLRYPGVRISVPRLQGTFMSEIASESLRLNQRFHARAWRDTSG